MEFNYEIRYKKGKENHVADALSRPPLETYVNKIDFETLVANADGPTEEDIADLDNILKDLQRESDDIQTIHTSLGRVEINIPYTESAINVAKNQVIFESHSSCADAIIKHIQLFDNAKKRIYCNLPLGYSANEILKVLKEIIAPNTNVSIYFKKRTMERDILKIMRENFNETVKIRVTNKFLEDVEDTNEQTKFIQYYHKGKMKHRGINAVYESLKNYIIGPTWRQTSQRTLIIAKRAI